MTNWRAVALADVCDFENGDRGKNYPGKSAILNEGVPFVNAGDLNDGSLRYDELSYISPDHFRKLSNGKFKKGDFLFCLRGTLGKYAFVENDISGAIASSLIIIRPKNSIFPSYLKSYLGSKICEEQIDIYRNGAAQPNLAASSLKKFEIPFPPLDEQRRIASILDKADALRRKRKLAFDLLRKLTQSIFLEMFGDPVCNPHGWAVDRLGNVCDVRDGTHASPKYVNIGYPLLTSKNFSGGALDATGSKLISREDFDEINRRSKVDMGDIVMPMIGTIGSPVLIVSEPKFAIKNVALFKFSDDSPLAEFVLHLLDGKLLETAVAQSSRGGTQKFLSLGDLRGLQVPLPPKDMQNRFKKLTTEYASRKVQYIDSIRLTELLFSSLQHRAFSGQL